MFIKQFEFNLGDNYSFVFSFGVKYSTTFTQNENCEYCYSKSDKFKHQNASFFTDRERHW